MLAALALAACSASPSEGKTVKIPTFDDTPGVTAPPTAPPPTPEWTPTWEASLPTLAPVIKPSGTTPPKPPPGTKPADPTKPPIITIPTLPGVPFVKEGTQCSPEGAIGITRSGQPMVCVKAGRGNALRWRAP